jgi:hypothetical protein
MRKKIQAKRKISRKKFTQRPLYPRGMRQQYLLDRRVGRGGQEK